MLQKISKLLSILGPGLLWAGAAIGVSHLVQSTRAGADYGFALVILVILANLFKYPFFEFGPRYAASTGQTLLVGYKKLGNWAFILYLLLTFLTMFAIVGAVTMVTSGVLIHLTGLAISPQAMSAIILLGSLLILALGHYKLLDNMMKVIIVLLTGTTLVALVAVLANFPVDRVAATPIPDLYTPAAIAFMVALMGWMPSAIDISVWSSIWTMEKRKENPEATTLKNALLDFNVGYVGTAIVAIAFLILGAGVMFGTGQQFSNKAGEFAGQFISLYTGAIGAWSGWLIGIAAFATMFSTSLTCVDAYGRVLSRSWSLIRTGDDNNEKTYWFFALLSIAGALLLMTKFAANMKLMVDVATTLSFLSAPILAILNYKVITSKDVPAEAQPPRWMKILSLLGFLFLTIFAIVYIKSAFFA